MLSNSYNSNCYKMQITSSHSKMQTKMHIWKTNNSQIHFHASTFECPKNTLQISHLWTFNGNMWVWSSNPICCRGKIFQKVTMASKTIYSKVTNKPQKLTNFTKPQKLTNSDHKFNTEIQITTYNNKWHKFKICKLSKRSSHNSNLHNFGGSLMRTSKNPFGATMSRKRE